MEDPTPLHAMNISLGISICICSKKSLSIQYNELASTRSSKKKNIDLNNSFKKKKWINPIGYIVGVIRSHLCPSFWKNVSSHLLHPHISVESTCLLGWRWWPHSGTPDPGDGQPPSPLMGEDCES